MMCPNCKTPCVGCAGAKIVRASNGATVCTRCVTTYEAALKAKTASSPTNIQITQNPQK